MKDDKAGAPDRARDAAIDWWLRQNDGPLSKKDRAAFEAWLASDEANKAAFEKIARIGGIVAARRRGTKPRRKIRRPRAKAAAVIAGTIALLAFYDDLSVYVHSDRCTGTGEMARVALEDGSQVELGPQSAVAVRYEAGRRRLVLLRGEAWFEATPDPTRPFVVEAAGGSVTALGTAFDVSVDKVSARVTVTTHRVSVTSGGKTTTVAEGQQSTFMQGAAAEPPEPVDVTEATAWRRGKLIFANKPLGDVVEALGRYHLGYVFFADPALRARPVSGVFKTDDPVAAFDEIEASLGLHVTYFSSYLIIISD